MKNYLQRYRMFYVDSSLIRNLMGDMQYKIWIFYQSGSRSHLPPAVFFCTPPLFIFVWSWTEILSSVSKCKNLASMVIICNVIGCFMLALFYLENLMGDMQYKMWFSIRVRVGPTSHPQCFSVHPPLFNFFWSWTKIVFSIRKCKHFA